MKSKKPWDNALNHDFQYHLIMFEIGMKMIFTSYSNLFSERQTFVSSRGIVLFDFENHFKLLWYVSVLEDVSLADK